jgi:hypothetical protein
MTEASTRGGVAKLAMASGVTAAKLYTMTGHHGSFGGAVNPIGHPGAAGLQP